MNKKIMSISALSSVAILGLIMALAPSTDVTTFELDENFSETLDTYSVSREGRAPQPNPLEELYGISVQTLDNAKIGNSVEPLRATEIPDGFESKAVYSKVNQFGDGIGDRIIQFYMLKSDAMTHSTTFSDVMDKGGFAIIQIAESSEFDKSKWLANYGKSAITDNVIGDSKVIVKNGDGMKGEKSYVIFYNGNTMVEFVSVSVDAKSLLRIANSLS